MSEAVIVRRPSPRASYKASIDLAFALRRKALSLENSFSIGFRSGLYALSLPTISRFGAEVGRCIAPSHHQLELVPAAPDRDPSRLAVVLPPQEAPELGQLPEEAARRQRRRPAEPTGE